MEWILIGMLIALGIVIAPFVFQFIILTLGLFLFLIVFFCAIVTEAAKRIGSKF